MRDVEEVALSSLTEERGEVFVDLADATLQLLVVGRRHGEELHSAIAQGSHCVHDVVRGERKVLEEITSALGFSQETLNARLESIAARLRDAGEISGVAARAVRMLNPRMESSSRRNSAVSASTSWRDCG